MFWRFGGYANISTLDTILDKQDLTLEELLDESDLIQELKQQNSKLIEFLRDEKVLKKLLDYVVAQKIPIEEAAKQNEDKQRDKIAGDATGPVSFFGRSGVRSSSKSSAKVEAEESEQEKKEAQRKKYAYVACEVLSSEVWSITEAVLENREHLGQFWQYVYRDAPLDPLQAGYFTKVNENLLDKKTEDMLAFFKSLNGVVDAMLQHVDCPMIMDLLLKIISLEKTDGGAGIVGWLQTQRLIPSLLTFLSADYPPATQTSAGDFLKAIITISANATTQDQSVIGPNELTRELVSERSIDLLIQEMLRGGNTLTVGVGIVIEVIRKNNSDYDIDTHTEPLPRSSDPIYLGTLLRRFAEHIADFMHLIRSKSATRPGLKAAFGSSVEPLGFDRFKTCELMAELLHCSNMGLLNERGAEQEIRKRDAEREKLRIEGKLLSAAMASDAEREAGNEAFSSSVDSHGFHHAEKPSDEEHTKVDSTATADEDGFEKVHAPSSDDLPDEVSFDDFQEKVTPHFDPPPTRAADSPVTDDVTHSFGEVTLHSSATSNPSFVPSDTDVDKPAPLFASKNKTPIAASSTSSGDETDDVAGSTATIQPEAVTAPGNVTTEAVGADDDSPVVGDLLKIRFVENHVVPTILDFFFRFPWNNFLHNVVYDVVQQVFNGALERGYNRQLALNLFEPITDEAGVLGFLSLKDITDRILDGQEASDKSQKARNMRLGYMGHLTLIAEEVCKFGARFASDAPQSLVTLQTSRDVWTQYIDGVLTETRDKDNAVLGGVRPESAMARGMGGNIQPTFNSGNSSALASAGLGSGMSEDDNLALSEGTVGEDYNASGSNVLSRFGDDDDDDELDDADGKGTGISPFTEDEQDTLDTESSSSNKGGISIPPPLNIGPSRARRQLAARLAQKKKEADAAEADPDSTDDAAVELAAGLPEQPSEIDLGPATERELQEAGLQITGLHGLQSGGTASRFSGLFGSDDSSSDSSLDEDDAGRDETLVREEADYEDEPLTFGRRGPRHGGILPRRPSTTEAKQREPLDDDDDDEHEQSGSA